MKNSIVVLGRGETSHVSGQGAIRRIVEEVLSDSLEIAKGLSFPVFGVFISYGIIKLLSKKHKG